MQSMIKILLFMVINIVNLFAFAPTKVDYEWYVKQENSRLLNYKDCNEQVEYENPNIQNIEALWSCEKSSIIEKFKIEKELKRRLYILGVYNYLVLDDNGSIDYRQNQRFILAQCILLAVLDAQIQDCMFNNTHEYSSLDNKSEYIKKKKILFFSKKSPTRVKVK